MLRTSLLLLLLSLTLHAKVIDVKEPPFLTEDTLHKYLGLSTVAMAATTAILRPRYVGDTVQGYALHRNLAYVTAGLAATTIITGVWFHLDDIGLDYAPLDYDNMHAILATAGGVMMIVAAFLGNDNMFHSTLGIAGSVSMGTAIVMEW